MRWRWQVEVVRDYEAQLDDELTLRVGDRIQGKRMGFPDVQSSYISG